jgi:peptide/nickel transport system permease protein
VAELVTIRHPLARWLARRLLLGIVVLWGAATLAFTALHLLPGDPARLIAGAESETTPAIIARIDAQYGFGRPLLDQYGIFVAGLARGHLGLSYQLAEPVATAIGGELWASASLALGGAVIGFLLALGVALTTAGRPRLRAVASTLELVCVSTPSFWVGILLLTVFSFRLHLFPVIGDSGIRSLVLPWITLALPIAGVLGLVMREGLERALDQPFALTVRARGATPLRLRFRHALRHALLPVLTLSGWSLSQLIGGVVVVETVFARQGIGELVVNAVSGRDFPVVTGVVLLTALVLVVINLVVDLLYRVVDPRLRAVQP